MSIPNVKLLCECDDHRCREPLPIEAIEYQWLKGRGYYIVVPGHESERETAAVHGDGWVGVHVLPGGPR